MHRIHLLAIALTALLIVTACSTSPTGRKQMIWANEAELEAEASQVYPVRPDVDSFSQKQSCLCRLGAGDELPQFTAGADHSMADAPLLVLVVQEEVPHPRGGDAVTQRIGQRPVGCHTTARYLT